MELQKIGGNDCFFRKFALNPIVRRQVLIESALEIDWSVFVERPFRRLYEVLQAFTSISKD